MTEWIDLAVVGGHEEGGAARRETREEGAREAEGAADERHEHVGDGVLGPAGP